jgi:transcriptional regulator with XRE-family HTH domain
MGTKAAGEAMRERAGDPERILGQRLRALREDAGLTQEQVAVRMQGAGHPAIRQNTIWKIESGRRPVRVNEAVTLAGILGIPLDGLLADPALDAEGSALWTQLQQVTAERLEAETERDALQAEITRAKEHLAEAGRRWVALDKRERDLRGQWLLARQRARGKEGDDAASG